jgi:hypothetical protein
VLLYIKPAMVGGENADLLNYSKVHQHFPHQSTADQWFDESQFESYRILGYRAGLAALQDVIADLAAHKSTGHADRIARMCAVLGQAGKGKSSTSTIRTGAAP